MNVLFVCVHNAGRSQIAEALFTRAAAGRHAARSAGSSPAQAVHAEWADVVVTMGCGDACPFLPRKRYVDWELDDPHGLPLERVREIRDEIGRRVEALLREVDSAPAGKASAT